MKAYLIWEAKETWKSIKLFFHKFFYPKTWFFIFIGILFINAYRRNIRDFIINLFIIIILWLWKRYESGEWKHGNI